MIRFFVQRAGCAAVALMMAVCIALLTACITVVAVFNSTAHIQSRIEKQADSIVHQINLQLKVMKNIDGIEYGACKNIINSDNIDVISYEVAKNLIYSYGTSFAESTELYDECVEHLTEYYEKKGVSVSGEQLRQNASLLVDYINEAVGTEETGTISVFSDVKSTKAVVILVGSIFLIIGGVIGVEIMNRRRHRKYSYFYAVLESRAFPEWWFLLWHECD